MNDICGTGVAQPNPIRGTQFQWQLTINYACKTRHLLHTFVPGPTTGYQLDPPRCTEREAIQIATPAIELARVVPNLLNHPLPGKQAWHAAAAGQAAAGQRR